MAPRVSPSGAEWITDVIKGGKEAFEDLGEEKALGMLDMLASKKTMNEVARFLHDRHMFVAEESGSTGVIALQIGSGYPGLSLYGAIRWAEMHGYTRCNEQDPIGFIRSSERTKASADYVSSHSKKFGRTQLDGYHTFHVYERRDDSQIKYSSSWEGDNLTLASGTRLLVRRSPLQLLDYQPSPEGTYCLRIGQPVTQKELESYLWLLELEFECVTNLSPKVTNLLSDPGSLVNAFRSDWTHCRTCYGRGSKQSAAACGRPPRETCSNCEGTGRIRRKHAH